MNMNLCEVHGQADKAHVTKKGQEASEGIEVNIAV